MTSQPQIRRDLIRSKQRMSAFLGVFSQVKPVVRNTVKISMGSIDTIASDLLMFTYNDVIGQRRSKK